MRHAIVIGSGFGGLGTACLLAKAGWKVTLLEKNEQPGGRASVWRQDGFVFDMGPSWYLMPDVFEKFFALLGEDVNQLLDLRRLDPAYRIFFKDTDKQVDIHSDIARDLPTLEQLEPGCSPKIRKYLAQAAVQYDISVNQFLHGNYDSLLDLMTWRAAKYGSRLRVFTSMHRYVSKFATTDEVQKILQYPLVFLGGSPYNTPALYCLMSHLDFTQGVFYPMGGIGTLVQALVTIAQKHGAEIRCNAEVRRIRTSQGRATGVELADGTVIAADIVVSNADMHATETAMLAPEEQTYPPEYWAKRTLAPSAFILYLGVKGKAPQLTHHNLIFSRDWQKNFSEIFDQPQWPEDPSMYICMPSATDPSVAPEGYENMFVLVPVASNLPDDDALRERYAAKIIAAIAQVTNIPDLADRIVVQRVFSVRDFAARYGSLGGSALGLAHTLLQTSVFRPNNVSKKVQGLYYVGASTNPGIGMPMCLISAELVYKRITGNRSVEALTTLATQM